MTIRSELVTQNIIDEYILMAQDKVKWGRAWGAFFHKEQLLSEWARKIHEKIASNVISQIDKDYDLDANIELIANALDAALISGLFIGERRLSVQSGELDWIQKAYEAPSAEIE